MMQETYITADAYDGILEKLETFVRTFDATAPDDLRTRLIMILGEDGGMWPTSCRSSSSSPGE